MGVLIAVLTFLVCLLYFLASGFSLDPKVARNKFASA